MKNTLKYFFRGRYWADLNFIPLTGSGLESVDLKVFLRFFELCKEPVDFSFQPAVFFFQLLEPGIGLFLGEGFCLFWHHVL